MFLALLELIFESFSLRLYLLFFFVLIQKRTKKNQDCIRRSVVLRLTDQPIFRFIGYLFYFAKSISYRSDSIPSKENWLTLYAIVCTVPVVQATPERF
jgi:hypothetical protein